MPAGKLLAIQNDLWSLIREEAIDAEREVQTLTARRRGRRTRPKDKAGSRPVAFRGAGFTPSAGRYSGWIALALVIAFWQLAGSAGWVNALFLPPPSAIVAAIYKLALSGALWQHLSWSVMRIGSGWILGTVAGVIVGFGIGLSTLARGVGITFISALFPISQIWMPPLLILWLGIGEEPKIATIALGVFFSTAISVYSGVDVQPDRIISFALATVKPHRFPSSPST